MIDRPFDAIEFAAYIRSRWIALAIACGVALAIALGVSTLLPRRYTATATILIQPPRGTDPRAATTLSQIYLESLKTYERFASSDTLFVRALDAVHARGSGGGSANASVEALKSSALKISKLPSTSLLEISVTLEDPVKAQALAQYIAQQTVELNKSLNGKSASEMVAEFRSQLTAAEASYNQARQADSAFASAQPVESLESDVQETSDLKYRLEQQLQAARADLAGDMAQPQNDDWVRRETASTRAKIAALENQTRELAAVLAKKGPELEARKARRDALDNELKSALGAYDTAKRRLNEILTSSEYQGERLEILDPGIVPQQPSSPKTMLNIVAALVMAFVASIVYLAFGFGRARRGTPIEDSRGERAYSLR